MKIILDNGKEYEFAVGTSEHNIMQAMLNIINNDNTPTINPNITSSQNWIRIQIYQYLTHMVCI